MKNQVSILMGATLLWAVFACEWQPVTNLAIANPDKSARQADATGTLLFQTGFDNSTITSGTNPQRPDITGSNISGYNWTGNEFGDKFRLYYEDGDNTQRRASITTDDVGANKILKYIISDVNVPSLNKARIQADLYSFLNTSTGQPYKEFYQSVRMKLHYSSFNKILQDNNLFKTGYQTGDWLTLFEFWNNGTWTGEDDVFRISVGLKKFEPSRNKFVLYADGQDIDPATQQFRKIPLWETEITNAANTIELGQWVTVDIYIKEGTAGNKDGRFWMAITPQEGPNAGVRRVICDYKPSTTPVYTQEPTDPSPDGFKDWNPIKLYTSAAVINTVKASPNPQSLQVSWDDYRLWKDKQPQ